MPPGKGHSYSQEIYAEVSASEVPSRLQYRRGGGEGKREGRVCKYGKLLMRACTNICVILSILLYVKKFENTNLGEISPT